VSYSRPAELPLFWATLNSCSFLLLVCLVVAWEPMGTGGFILSHRQANRNWVALFHFPLVSYVVQNSGSIAVLATCFHIGLLLGLFLTLKIEVICFSKTSVDVQHTAWYYISEDITLYNHWYENLKSHMKISSPPSPPTYPLPSIPSHGQKLHNVSTQYQQRSLISALLTSVIFHHSTTHKIHCKNGSI
jgi:hypothetical protein